MNTKTTFFELNGNQYKVELVEAKEAVRPTVFAANHEQCRFMDQIQHPYTNGEYMSDISFNQFISKDAITVMQWQNFLISEARKQGFISGCTIKTATDMDKMKSGKMQLIGLSKLAVCGRKQIIIYDNGRWCAEAIPEVKKHFWTNNSMLSMKNWERFNSLTDVEMEKIKCEPEKHSPDELRRIIGDLTRRIDSPFYSVAITKDDANLIREILNDYLNK